MVCSTAIFFQSIALKRTNLIRGTSWGNEFWMSNFTTCTLFFWYLMMPRGYCDYRCSAAEFVCNLKISLLVYYSVFAHTALSKCEDCLCPMNCADGTEGHALCMCVNDCKTAWIGMRLFMPKELFLTLTKVSVYVCVFFTMCAGLSLSGPAVSLD